MSRENALVVMMKYPEPGRVKTRLAPPLTGVEASRLYRCFIEDTFERIMPLAQCSDADERVSIHSAFTPLEKRGDVTKLLPAWIPLILQRGGDLGERLGNIFSDLIVSGYKRVVVIGSDSPDIPLAYIEYAFILLREKPGMVVLGPSEDGGYYLIGMDRANKVPFEKISWGGDTVLRETIKRCGKGDIEVSLLPEWRDVDTIEDLEPLINSRHLPATTRFINDYLGHITGDMKGSQIEVNCGK
ncbi:MAG: glycosyltransferase [Deltaproteobacteria bacterium]|nr:glycosyltransferase [Deltaproteobacteria bacterium]